MKVYYNSIVIFFLIIFLIFFVFGLLNKKIVENKIRVNHDIVCAEITNIRRDKASYLLFYKFCYQGKVYVNHVSCLNETKELFDKGKVKVLVVVLRNNGEESDLLETKKDYIKYKVYDSDTIGVNCKNQ